MIPLLFVVVERSLSALKGAKWDMHRRKEQGAQGGVFVAQIVVFSEERERVHHHHHPTNHPHLPKTKMHYLFFAHQLVPTCPPDNPLSPPSLVDEKGHLIFLLRYFLSHPKPKGCKSSITILFPPRPIITPIFFLTSTKFSICPPLSSSHDLSQPFHYIIAKPTPLSPCTKYTVI
jgi:hypothetical protein